MAQTIISASNMCLAGPAGSCCTDHGKLAGRSHSWACSDTPCVRRNTNVKAGLRRCTPQLSEFQNDCLIGDPGSSAPWSASTGVELHCQQVPPRTAARAAQVNTNAGKQEFQNNCMLNLLDDRILCRQRDNVRQEGHAGLHTC